MKTPAHLRHDEVLKEFEFIVEDRPLEGEDLRHFIARIQSQHWSLLYHRVANFTK
ncbi:hypothetical protein O9929_04575 [Vibrio lentus]|nr:hypothetical protein [Vibrio lentus]